MRPLSPQQIHQAKIKMDRPIMNVLESILLAETLDILHDCCNNTNLFMVLFSYILFDIDRNMEVGTVNYLHRNPASIIDHEECDPNCYGRRYVGFV